MIIPLVIDFFADKLRYDAETGVIFWRERKLDHGISRLEKGWNTRFKDKPAGRPHRHGHLQININYKNYSAHRIAWLLFYGDEPQGQIDHINGNPADNRIVNLRIANQSQNMANAATRSNNTSGVRGVSWSKREGKWYAYINKDRKMYALGKTDSFEAACAIRKAAEVDFFGEYRRGASSSLEKEASSTS